MEEVKANAEEITDLRKQFVAQEKEYRASSAEVVQLKSKIKNKIQNQHLLTFQCGHL